MVDYGVFMEEQLVASRDFRGHTVKGSASFDGEAWSIAPLLQQLGLLLIWLIKLDLGFLVHF
jgi:hypothetical protein